MLQVLGSITCQTLFFVQELELGQHIRVQFSNKKSTCGPQYSDNLALTNRMVLFTYMSFVSLGHHNG